MNSDDKFRWVRSLGALFVLCMGAAALLVCLTGSAAAKGEKTASKIPFPKPQSHTGAWLEYHGRAVEPTLNPDGVSGSNCLTCHERTDCISCHNTQMPRDHSNTWRTLSHGFMAEGNRDRCKNCHRQDFCVRCHNETAPRSHVGSWRTRHCTWCHFSSGFTPADTCAVCHRKAPHTSAPHAVTPTMDCTLCHH